MRTPTTRRRNAGFSLLEVLIALVILSVGLLALASLQLSLIRSSAEAKAQSIGMAIAKDRVEDLRAYTSEAAYIALADQAATVLSDVGGNQGGIDFTRTTTVTRYVYDATSLAFESRPTDTESDATLTAVAGNTYKPGKEFKRIHVEVTWTDAAGGSQAVALEDAIGSINPEDTIDLHKTPTTSSPRLAKVVRTNPGNVDGVIPLVIGNGTSTAATNPTPVVNANNQGSKVVETLFEVLTYASLNASDPDSLVQIQSRVDTSLVSCKCDYGTAPDVADAVYGYRPTYWNGTRYAAPERAEFLVPAGEAVIANNDIDQSTKCAICCRDHHDPVSATGPKFSPRRDSHTHNYLVGTTLTTAVEANDDDYLEVCRVVRVDGILRVATDMYNDHEALVETDLDGDSPYPGSDVGEGEEAYSGFVLDYVQERVVDNNVPSTYNTKLRVRSAASGAPQDAVKAAIAVIENANSLNDPAALQMQAGSDFKWLHSRGLYIDYLEEDARDAIVAAKAACTGTDFQAPDTDEEWQACVLPLLPFTSINTSEIARWSVSDEDDLTVTNADFKLVTDATGDTDPVKGQVVPDTGASPGDAPTSSSTILDSNAGLTSTDIAVNADEIDVYDTQTFDIIGSPPVGNTSGTVYVEIAGGTGVLPSYSSTQAPQAFYNYRYSAQTTPAPCDPVSPSSTVGYPNPYTCQDALVGGGGSGVIQSYNYSPAAKLSFTGSVTCTKGNNSITVTVTRDDRPQCKNLDVASADLERAGIVVASGTNKSELNDGLSTEITTYDFADVQTGDVIIFNFVDETADPYPDPTTSDYTCTYTGNDNNPTLTFNWNAQCPSQ